MRKVDIPNVGDIYYAELPYCEHVQSGVRPVIVAQNDIGNAHSPTIHVIPLTKHMNKAHTQPTHVMIVADEQNGLKRNSVALVEDMRPVLTTYLGKKIGEISPEDFQNLRTAFKVQFPFAG